MVGPINFSKKKKKKDKEQKTKRADMIFFSHFQSFFSRVVRKGRSVTILQSKSFNYTSNHVIETQFGFGVNVCMCRRWVYCV